MYKLNPALREFWQTQKPYKLLKGGRFSSKTQDAGGMAVFLARNYSLKFLCIRQFQNRIANSVYTVILEKINNAGWKDEFHITDNTIKHKATGSSFLFYGIARNIEDIKGTEGVDVCWIEEGEGLTENQWSYIDPTIRAANAEIWLLWNPELVSDFAQTKLPRLLGDDCIVKHINYTDNPFLSESARAKAERLKAVDIEAYNHIYLGIPKSDDDATLIKRSWIEAAIDAHITLNLDMTGVKNSALDIADEGKDKNAQSFTDGLILRDIDIWKGQVTGDIYATVERAVEGCVNFGCYKYLYDADGMGAGARGDSRKINEARASEGLDEIESNAFHGSGAVLDKDKFFIEASGDARGVTNGQYFSNYKAQSWWDLRERFRKTYQAVALGQVFDKDELISIDSNCSFLEELKEELATPRKKRGSLKFTVDKAPGDAPSPNAGDCIMMVYAPKEAEAVDFLSMDW